jgi:hypothetical protein
MSSGHVDATSWAGMWGRKFLGSLPALLLLTSLATIAHWFHPDIGLAEEIERRVAWGFYELRANRPQDDKPPFATVLTLRTQDVRDRFLVDDKPASETLDRLGGAWPVDRVKLATALAELAGDLSATAHRHQVLALDIDLAPLEAASASAAADASQRMVGAIDALRPKFAALIVTVLSRGTDVERGVRRQFLQLARCSTPLVRAQYPGLTRLYLASPRLEIDERGQVARFLGELKEQDALRLRNSGYFPPREFPSLGVLLKVAARPAHAHGAGLSADELALLESQCIAATRDEPRQRPLTTEEALDELAQARPADRLNPSDIYTHELIDWTGLSDSLVVSSPLELASDASSPPAQANGGPPATGGRIASFQADQAASAAALVLALEGESLSDKYLTPSNAQRRVSGAVLHAAVANSHKHEAGPLASLAIDVVAGLLFLGAWTGLDTRLREAEPGLRRRHTDAPIPPQERFAVALCTLVLVAILVVVCVCLWFGIVVGEMNAMLDAAPAFTKTVWIASLGTGFVAMLVLDGVWYGQPMNGIRAAIPWSLSLLERLYPLGVAAGVAAIALLASLDSLLTTASFRDVTLLLAGLLLHSYVEASHLHEGRHVRLRDSFRLALFAAQTRDLPHPTWRRIDAGLHCTLWIAVLAIAWVCLTSPD